MAIKIQKHILEDKLIQQFTISEAIVIVTL